MLQRSFLYLFHQECTLRRFSINFTMNKYFMQTTFFSTFFNRFQHCKNGMKFSQTKYKFFINHMATSQLMVITWRKTDNYSFTFFSFFSYLLSLLLLFSGLISRKPEMSIKLAVKYSNIQAFFHYNW